MERSSPRPLRRCFRTANAANPIFKPGDQRGAAWSDAARLQTTTRLNLRPTPSAIGKGRKVASVDGWPHLGLRINGNVVSVSMDPRPLAPPTLGDGALHTVIVAEGQGLRGDRMVAQPFARMGGLPAKGMVGTSLRVSGEDLGR